MKTIACIFLLILPITAFAEIDLDMQNQMLDSQIETLTRERDSKYEALQKCEKNTKGFKIAGITTLVATGVGIYGNIKLSQKLKGKDKTGSGGNGAVIDNRSRSEIDAASCRQVDCPEDLEECEKCLDEE